MELALRGSCMSDGSIILTVYGLHLYGLHLPSVAKAKYVDPEKALEAKERGNEQFRAGQWALAISEYEEVSVAAVLLSTLNRTLRFKGHWKA